MNHFSGSIFPCFPIVTFICSVIYLFVHSRLNVYLCGELTFFSIKSNSIGSYRLNRFHFSLLHCSVTLAFQWITKTSERKNNKHHFVRFNATQNDNELLTMARHEKASFPIKSDSVSQKSEIRPKWKYSMGGKTMIFFLSAKDKIRQQNASASWNNLCCIFCFNSKRLF